MQILEVHATPNPEMTAWMAGVADGQLRAQTPGVVCANEPVFPAGPYKANAYTFQMAVVDTARGALVLVYAQSTVIKIGGQLQLLILFLQGQQPS